MLLVAYWNFLFGFWILDFGFWIFYIGIFFDLKKIKKGVLKFLGTPFYNTKTKLTNSIFAKLIKF